jgi:23S rRNA-/tRNA-specific pseudouridylate synthase
MFQQHSFRKKYMAITAKTHAISTNHSWIVENHLAPVRDAKKKLMRMVVVKKADGSHTRNFNLSTKMKMRT